MNKFYSSIKFLFFLLLFFICFTNTTAQSEQLTKHIQEKLVDIDALIANKDYNLALSKLTDLESYKNYIGSKKNSLTINLKRAQAYYGNEETETAMGLLLHGLDDLNTLNFKDLKIEYLKYLGKIFYDSKDYNTSLAYYRSSLLYSNRILDTLNILDSYLNIGKVFSQKNKIDSAIHYYSLITKYPFNSTTKDIIAKGYNNLSAKAVDVGDLELAEDYSNKSLEIKIKEDDTLGIAFVLVNLGGIKYQTGEFEEARINYLKAYESLSSIKSERAYKLRSDILYNLAFSSEELKDFKKAYFHLLDATELKDSLADATLTKNISEVNAKYNVAKQAQKTEEEKSKRQRTQYLFYGSILLFAALLVLAYIFYRNYRLKQENELDKVVNETQIKIINATIDAKENERKSIAETLHDSVSALLSSANLHLQATKAQLKTGYPQEITKAQTIVNEASVKIRDLSHELISSVLLKFGLAFAVHDMCQKYSNSEISLFSDDDGIKRYEQNFEIKIHNIIEELVNNILKHSKAKNASIILAHRDNNMLSIRMNDDGIGFDAKKAKMKGGLGLSHIEARIKVMKGVFNIVSSKDNGTSIFILVPIVSREV
jgi:signal transduction histidine kinase